MRAQGRRTTCSQELLVAHLCARSARGGARRAQPGRRAAVKCMRRGSTPGWQARSVSHTRWRAMKQQGSLARRPPPMPPPHQVVQRKAVANGRGPLPCHGRCQRDRQGISQLNTTHAASANHTWLKLPCHTGEAGRATCASPHTVRSQSSSGHCAPTDAGCVIFAAIAETSAAAAAVAAHKQRLACCLRQHAKHTQMCMTVTSAASHSSWLSAAANHGAANQSQGTGASSAASKHQT